MKGDEHEASTRPGVTPPPQLSKLDELLVGDRAPTLVDSDFVAAAAPVETPARPLDPIPAPARSTPVPAPGETTAAARSAAAVLAHRGTDSHESAPARASAAPDPKGLDLWEEPTPEKRRELPKKALAIAAGVALLLLLPLIFGHGSGKAAESNSAPSSVPDDLIVNERDLKNRVEVSADDFRPKRAAIIGSAQRTSTLAAPPPLEVGAGDGVAGSGIARRSDPEDLIAHRAGGSGGSSAEAASSNDDGDKTSHKDDGYRRPFIYLQPSGGAAAASSPGAAGGAALVPAGAVIPVSLSTPVDIRGGGASSCIALVEGDGMLPKGSRFVGRASTDGEGRVSLRFERVLLADGREGKVEAEAQDASGGFGVDGNVTEEGGRSVAKDIAADTAADVAAETVDTFTGGLLGRVAGNTIHRVSSRRGMAAQAVRRVSLPAGSKFQLFLHQPVVVR